MFSTYDRGSAVSRWAGLSHTKGIHLLFNGLCFLSRHYTDEDHQTSDKTIASQLPQAGCLFFSKVNTNGHPGKLKLLPKLIF